MSAIKNCEILSKYRLAYLGAIKSKMINEIYDDSYDSPYLEFKYLDIDFIITTNMHAFENVLTIKTQKIHDKEMLVGDRKFIDIPKMEIVIKCHTNQLSAKMNEFDSRLEYNIQDNHKLATNYQDNLDICLKEIELESLNKMAVL